MRLEGLCKLKKRNDFFGNRARDFSILLEYLKEYATAGVTQVLNR
jgi:hypothetical protein